nr:DUF4340 domain-containing protein [uncultured Cellulosilyticum sp.]
MKKKFGVILAALAVVVGGVFYAQYKVQIEAMSTEVLVEEIALPLSLLTEEEIEKIEIQDKNSLTLEKKDTVWQNPLEPELTYNNELVNEWVKYFQSEESINVIRHVEDLSVYGIDETTPKVVIYSEKGNSQTFRLGSINEEQTIRYIYSDETELVYSVSPTKSEVLLVESDMLIDENIEMPNLEKVNSMVINQQGTTLNLQKEKDKWFLKDYFNDAYEVKAEVMVGLLEALNGLEKVRLVGKVEPEMSYGMDTPSLSITLDEKYTLNFGSKQDGEYYFSENDGPYVYTVKDKLLKSFEQLKPLQMIHRSVYRPEAEEIESIVMTNPQNVYKLKLQEVDAEETQEEKEDVVDENLAAEEVKEASKESTQEQIQEQIQEENKAEAIENKETDVLNDVLASNLVGVLNDKVLDPAKTESLLNLIEDSVCIETILQNPQIEQKTERKAEISIVYYMKDGSQKNIELISYDTNYYILRIDGNIEFAANKEKVTTLFSELGKILKSTK